jgi:hypothetical protein
MKYSQRSKKSCLQSESDEIGGRGETFFGPPRPFLSDSVERPALLRAADCRDFSRNLRVEADRLESVVSRFADRTTRLSPVL